MNPSPCRRGSFSCAPSAQQTGLARQVLQLLLRPRADVGDDLRRRQAAEAAGSLEALAGGDAEQEPGGVKIAGRSEERRVGKECRL